MILKLDTSAPLTSQLAVSNDMADTVGALLRSKGWAMFADYVQRDAAQALASARHAKALEPADALRVLTAYNTAMQMLEWPEAVLREAQAFQKWAEEQLAEEKLNR